MGAREERLREVFNTVEPHVEKRYGIPVIVKDVPSPFTGDLDGAEIHIDYDETIESALFIIVHLFGHTVQWNICDEARRLGTMRPEDVTPADLQALLDYEAEAAGYSLQLFHEAGVHDLDPWLSDFSACDVSYLEHFYRTGEKREFRSFWRDGVPLVAPLPIPDFHPTQWVGRWDGVVI